jgi:hypothetical protein
MTCPVWDPKQPSGGSDLDHRIQWIHQHQNPPDCSEANYLIRALTPRIGFGANWVLSVESTMYIALYSQRVFLLDPLVPFRYANCSTRGMECYFEPLSRCTATDAEAIVEARGGIYDQLLHNKTHRVIRTEKVRRLREHGSQLPDAQPSMELS